MFIIKIKKKILQLFFFSSPFCILGVITLIGSPYFLSGDRLVLPALPYPQSIIDKAMSLPLGYSSRARDSGNMAV